MRIQQIFARIVGSVSLVIGILRFFIPALASNIPSLDGIIHIVTGTGFIGGAWLSKGQYVNKSNLWLGVFYILFGVNGNNYPHIILGVISVLIGLFVKIKKTNRPFEQ